MTCPKCDKLMESMGYGDEVCPECGHVEYSESAEDFYNRVGGIKPENSCWILT